MASVDVAHGRHDWLRAGAFEVAPGVHRIPLPMPGDEMAMRVSGCGKAADPYLAAGARGPGVRDARRSRVPKTAVTA